MTAASPACLSILAPAKINLSLRICGKRQDGFHELESVVTKVTLYDGIDVFATTGPAIKIECDDPAVPTDARNLLWQAADLLASHHALRHPLLIRLLKKIPSEAGLGGASSDAASLLKALNDHWKLGLHTTALSASAAKIGSDVASFLWSGPVIMRGRGEIIEPVNLPWAGWLILLFPPFGIPTAAVYNCWRPAMARHDRQTLACLDPGIRTAEQLNECLFNDLEEAIFEVEPRLKDIRQTVERSSNRVFHVTGSGSTLFTCCDTHEDAQAVQDLLNRDTECSSQIVRVLTPSELK